MIHICRTSTAVLLAALIAIPSTVLAETNLNAPRSTRLTYNGLPLANVPFVGAEPSMSLRERAVSSGVGQWGYGRRRRHHDSAVTAMVLGAAGAIAGTAALVYANRPECSANPNLGGCGYGTKVVGSAVLSAGLVGLLVGAISWR